MIAERGRQEKMDACTKSRLTSTLILKVPERLWLSNKTLGYPPRLLPAFSQERYRNLSRASIACISTQFSDTAQKDEDTPPTVAHSILKPTIGVGDGPISGVRGCHLF